ncbi:MAG: tripartite tricarboxylate transporter substrate binding protein, partial [Pygmaiobacter massiliensis]|nr:tripartite tricarboxylate transporter substrate binding protein [Pygmaiobacter massiliensis]
VAGSAGTIMLSMLQKAYGLDFKTVTYDSGNDFRTALLGGHVDFIPGSANGDLGLGDEAKVLVVCGSVRNKIWPDTPCTDEIWPELAIPASLGSCRFFAAGAKAAADYPERFQALLETYEKAFNNPEYQKSLESSGQLYVSGLYSPEDSTAFNNSLHTLIEQYKDVLSET